MQAQPFQLQRQVLGALPIFDPVIERIGLLPCLTQALGQARYAEAILLLLKNILVERQALYAIRQWTAPYDPALVYGGKYGDDVLARAVDLSQIHQDTTSVKLTGACAQQHHRAVQLVRGYSKDHRPDLRQLVYELSVTRVGAIPVLFKAHDGNHTDDTLH